MPSDLLDTGSSSLEYSESLHPYTKVPSIAPTNDSVPNYKIDLSTVNTDSPDSYSPENNLELNSVIINHDRRHGQPDVTRPSFIAQAYHKANPNVQIIVPTDLSDITSVEQFEQKRSALANELRVPVENIYPIDFDTPLWSQDDFVTYKKSDENFVLLATSNSELALKSRTSDGSKIYQSLLGYRELAGSIEGVDSALSPFIGLGGDIQVVETDEGVRTVLFGDQTIDFAGKALGYKNHNDLTRRGITEKLELLGSLIDHFSSEGIETSRILPLGHSEGGDGVTYGEILETLSEDELSNISDTAMQRFKEMADYEFPLKEYSYHIDTNFFTADGENILVSSSVRFRSESALDMLSDAGFNVVEIPGGMGTDPHNPEPGKVPIESYSSTNQYTKNLEINYANMVSFKVDGVLTILMPTEAYDIADLTDRDIEVMNILEDTYPDSNIIPVGGRSAYFGNGVILPDTEYQPIGKRSGVHCMSNILPFRLREVR